MSNLKQDYWKEQDSLDLKECENFYEVGQIALRVQMRMPDNISQVCGPISTGGYGSVEKNMLAFSKTVEKFLELGENLYNQVPLEDAIFRIRGILGDKFDRDELLIEIYGPLFNSGRLKKLYFIHGWESSYGARWENDLGKEKGMEIVHLPKGFVDIE